MRASSATSPRGGCASRAKGRPPQWYIRLLGLNLRHGPVVGTLVGCAIGAAAIAYGGFLVVGG